MKICHIVSGDLWAGAESQAYYLMLGLSGIPSVDLSAITFNSGILSNKLSNEGIKVEVVSEKEHNFSSMLVGVVTFLRKNRADLIHVHGFKENFIGGIAAKLLRVTGVVRTHHGLGMVEGSLRNRFIEKVNASFLTGYNIAVSSDLKNRIASTNIRAKNIHVIHNGVNMITSTPIKSPISCRKELNISEGEIVIGTIGRIERIKGHAYFLEGAQRILSKNKNVIFLIVGDGSLYNEMVSYAKDLGIKDKVIFTGFRQDAIDLLNVFDIFTMTSLHEGIPMVLLEAMFLGKPIVSTRVGGVPEVIRDADNGLLIPPRSPHVFFETCMRLMNDENLRKRISKTALRDAKEKYNSEIMAEKTLQLYKNILDE